MPEQNTTTMDAWDFYNQRIIQEATGGQFVSAESTLIASGPPAQSDISGGGNSAGSVYPIGLLESFGVSQNKQLQRLFEIGSSRSYFVPGRAFGSINMGRTMYHGPNILKALYAYYRTAGGADAVDIGTLPVGTFQNANDFYKLLDPQAALLDTYETSKLPKIRRSPGEGHIFLDLASDLFSMPTGIAMFLKDQNGRALSGLYFEECYVQSHQFNVSSSSSLIMEGTSVQYDRITPIKVLS